MTKKTITIPVEEVNEVSGVPAVVEAKTGEQYISEAVAEVSKTEIAIADLKTKYEGLKCESLEDRPTYFAIVEGAKTVKNIRLAVERKRKELNEFPLEYQRSVNAEAKRITAELTPLEEQLIAEKQKFEDAEAAAKAADETRKRNLLVEAGFKFDGFAYHCGVHIVPAGSIAGMEDAQIEYYVSEGAKIAEMEAAAEKRRQDEQAALDKQQADIAAAQAALDKQQAAIQKMLDEANKAKADAEAAMAAAKAAAQPVSPAPVVPEPTITVDADASDTPPSAVDALNAMAAFPTRDELPLPSERRVYRNFEPKAPEQPTAPAPDPTPSPVATHSPEYLDGFEHCRALILEVFADPTPRNRAGFVEAIKNVQP